jgi:hypothetical protein
MLHCSQMTSPWDLKISCRMLRKYHNTLARTRLLEGGGRLANSSWPGLSSMPKRWL